MGISISKTLYGLRYNNEKEMKVSMIGIDDAGKTTILYRLLKGETVTTIPTIGIYLIFYIFFIFYLDILINFYYIYIYIYFPFYVFVNIIICN